MATLVTLAIKQPHSRSPILPKETRYDSFPTLRRPFLALGSAAVLTPVMGRAAEPKPTLDAAGVAVTAFYGRLLAR